ncbi:hypothetical protein NEIRO03_0370 [Nematocida sp. AWRm78]|nr:hypothetical protein NEIRO02_0386 [Nematocida sp. AWRm79]KAI5182719.1 hypothetical protein NEIRO03_0370 [Nematocida sp. AWRm78]
MEVKIINTKKRQAAVATCLVVVSIIMFFIDISCISETMKTILSIELAILAVTIWANNPKSSKRTIPIAIAISLHIFVYIGKYILSSLFAAGSPELHVVKNLIKEIQNPETRVELITQKLELEPELKSELAAETESSGSKLKHMQPRNEIIENIVSLVIDEAQRRKIAAREEDLKMQQKMQDFKIYNKKKNEYFMQEDITENDKKSKSEGKIVCDTDMQTFSIDSSETSSDDTHKRHNIESKKNEKSLDLKQGDSKISSNSTNNNPSYYPPYDSYSNNNIIYTSPPPKEYIDRWNLCVKHQLPYQHYYSNGSVCETYGMVYEKDHGICLKSGSEDDITPPIEIKTRYTPIVNKNPRNVSVDSRNPKKLTLDEEFEEFLKKNGLDRNRYNKDPKKPRVKYSIEAFHFDLKELIEFVSIESPNNKKLPLLKDKLNQIEEIINRHKKTSSKKRSSKTHTNTSKMSIASENPSTSPTSTKSRHSTKSKKEHKSVKGK